MPRLRRRDFLRTTALTGAAALAGGFLPDGARASEGAPSSRPTAPQSSAGNPILITSANGVAAAQKAMSMILGGSDALDAVIGGVNIVEDDPEDTSVGYGGLPNEEGVVELDAAVMHGPSYRAGAVAAIRNIRNPSKVARLVMERSDHVLIVGDGALKFAKAHGFPEENLLTDKAREIWLRWKETLNAEDDWLPPHGIDDDGIGRMFDDNLRTYGTIHMSALDKGGNLSCVTTTSGLAFKIPGRVGDSPIIGAGLYCDNEVGSAGSTGRGEANLLNCSSVMVVEWMRQGKSPEEACLLACKRINQRQRERRLQDKDGRFKHNVKFYAINRKGEYGAAGIRGTWQYVIHDGKSVKKLDGAYLFKS
ncbi:MAG TPA: N(4)-(beta-N-acetylglucosaminyl)-L-asparaginase [Bacteroidota bacterium]|nr:N(4)-(beta-N-acetylglucosaminyl)-L-asparaginase [Bacteroidota bacterium]